MEVRPVLEKRNFVAYSALLVGLLLTFSIVLIGSPATLAQNDPVSIEDVPLAVLGYHVDDAVLEATIDTSQFSPPSPDPAGLTYLSTVNRLLIADSEVDEMPIYQGANLFETTLSGTLIRTATTLPFSNEPTGVGFNADNGHLFFSDDGPDEVFEWDPVADVVTSFDTNAFGSYDPEGVTFNSANGRVYVIDGLGTEMYEVDPGLNGIFDGVPPTGDDQVAHFDVLSAGLIQPEGITFNPDGDTLFVLDSETPTIAEMTTTGQVVRLINIGGLVKLYHPAAVAYGRSSTSPGQRNLYFADRGIDNDKDPNENDGKVYEVSFPAITPGNLPPTVNAGPDQLIMWPANATVNGTATDDGLPKPPQFTSTWSQVSGPGTATFADASDPTTMVSFSQAGPYVLRLTADDGELAPSDDVTIMSAVDIHYLPFVLKEQE
jgi:hypothetical protein